MIRALAVSLLLLAVGCGNAATPPVPGPPDMELPNRPPTDHPPLWQLASASGIGSVVQSAPEVYTVMWPGDPYGARLEAFMAWMLASDYWTSSMKEYNVRAGKSMGLVVLPTAAPATLAGTDFAPIVDSLIANGTIANPNSNTNVAFIIPTTTVVTSDGQQSCSYFGGYHSRTSGAKPVVISIIAECDGFHGALAETGGSVFDYLTKVASHEIAEAASDPIYGQGFVGTQGDTEVGDLCNFAQTITYDTAGDATHPPERYFVERIYSFATAKLGNADPCVPLPFPRPYFNVMTDSAVINLTLSATPTTDPYTMTTKLEPFAYGDVGVIHWRIIISPFDVQPSSGTVHAGDTVLLTITAPSNTPTGANELDIECESEKAGANTWPFFINVARSGQERRFISSAHYQRR